MAKPLPHVIENVTLEKIREDGAQFYKWGETFDDCLWLTGWNRATNVHAGMKGKLEYRTGPGYGLHFFVPEPK